MEENTVLNMDVRQKDPSRAVVIAISHDAVFDIEEQKPESTDTASDVLRQGPGFSLVKAVELVNEKLVEKNPGETLLFDIILISSNDCPKIQSQMVNSTKHYGLEISRFCFCSNENFAAILLSKKVRLFLSTHTNYIAKAQETGVPAALLYRQGAHALMDQLRVLFIADSLGFSEDMADRLKDRGFDMNQLQNFQFTQGSFRELVALLGEMRRKFGRGDSPLSAGLVTVCSPRDVCARAVQHLRTLGLEVDEAFCLAGSPQSIILAQIQPHILYNHGLHYTSDVLALS
ncbi:cytosolic 5'-nucleotidase 1A-like isoform X2 [Arapaima gigas]